LRSFGLGERSSEWLIPLALASGSLYSLQKTPDLLGECQGVVPTLFHAKECGQGVSFVAF